MDTGAREPGKPTRSKWYGWQILPIDAFAVFSFLGSEQAAIVGAFFFTFGGPVVHAAHGDVAKGFASLGIRMVTPLLFLGVERDGPEVAIAAAVLASGIDVAALAWKNVPVERRAARRIEPMLALGSRQAAVGLKGQF